MPSAPAATSKARGCPTRSASIATRRSKSGCAGAAATTAACPRLRRAGWAEVDRAAVDHDRTAYPLRGRHVSVRCDDCHPNGKLRPIAHESCLDCHVDPHAGEVGVDCARCHAVQGFAPTTYGPQAHTGFPLAGGHAATTCPDCHLDEGAWGFRLGVSACAVCHVDPHEAQFGDRTCDACHVEAAWSPAPGVDHDLWPLDGAHTDAACAACHVDGHYAGAPKVCRDCHGSPHLGQFVASEPRRDCADCHTTEIWKGEFDHAPVWALEGAHATAECVACHKEVRVDDGRATTRWRLGLRACARCHENVHRRATGQQNMGREIQP